MSFRVNSGLKPGFVYDVQTEIHCSYHSKPIRQLRKIYEKMNVGVPILDSVIVYT